MRRMREEVGDRRGQGPRRVCGVVKAWPVRQCAWLVRAVQLFAMVSCLDTSRVAPGLTAAFVGQRSPARTAAGLSGPRCPQMPGASLAYPCKSGRGCPRPLGNQHRSRTALRSTKSGRVFVDHYEVLGVAAAAEPAEIKLAFRALSRKYHPDVNPDSEQEIYRRITASYNILSDPERRALYDRKRVQARSSSGGGQLLQNFEDALQKRWTTHGAGHSCNAFCDCDPGTAPDAGTTEPQAYQDWLTAGEPEETFRGRQAKKSMRRADSSSWQDVEGACDEIDDAGRVLTPPSAFEELSSFLAQAKRASYSRPRIYTCSWCGGSSAIRDKCDLCGTSQSGPSHTIRNQDRVFPVYSMHKFGSHLDDDRRHELVHKHHISRSSPAHTRRARLDDLGILMPVAADIDTGTQRIWGQVSPNSEMPEPQAPFGTGRFDAGMDFYGVTETPKEIAKTQSGASSERKTEDASDVQSSAISGGCWVLGEMHSSPPEVERRREDTPFEAVSVLQKEATVTALEAKVEECRRELAMAQQQLSQARTDLMQAKTQQGWSGAGAVGMGGAGAVFSTTEVGMPPAIELSDVFSSLSSSSPLTASFHGDMTTAPSNLEVVSSNQSWSGPGGVGVENVGAVILTDDAVPGEGLHVSTAMQPANGTEADERAEMHQGWDHEIMDGRLRSNGSHSTSTAKLKYGAVREEHECGRVCGEGTMICSTCGCHTQIAGDRCDCCGQQSQELSAEEGSDGGFLPAQSAVGGEERIGEKEQHELLTAKDKAKGSARFGTLEELNSYLSSRQGGGDSATEKITTFERDTPDVPWQAGGGLEETDEGLGLGAFHRLVEETKGWLGGDGDGAVDGMQSGTVSEDGVDVMERQVGGDRVEVDTVVDGTDQDADKTEREERARLEDLSFFVSQMKAYASRLRGEADRAAILVKEMEGAYLPPPGVQIESLPLDQDEKSSTLSAHQPADKTGSNPSGKLQSPPKKRRILSAASRRSSGNRGGVPADIRRQRGSGVFGVYTMHGSSATRLADDDHHSLMHINHIHHSDTTQLAMNTAIFDADTGGQLSPPEALAGFMPADQVSDEAQGLKNACRPCIEIEEMLQVNQAIGSMKRELRQLQSMRLEARKLNRESDALDIVVSRHTEQLMELKSAFYRKHGRPA